MSSDNQSKSADSDNGRIFIFVPFTKEEDGKSPPNETQYATMRESAKLWAKGMSEANGADSRKVPTIVSFGAAEAALKAYEAKQQELQTAKDNLSILGKITSFLNRNAKINSLKSEVKQAQETAGDHASRLKLLQGATSKDSVYVIGHTGVGGDSMVTSSHTRVPVAEIGQRMKDSIGGGAGKIKVWGCHSGSDGIDRKTDEYFDSVAKRLCAATSDHFSAAEFFGYKATVGFNTSMNKKYGIEHQEGVDKQVKASSKRVKVSDSLKANAPKNSPQQGPQSSIRH